MNNTELIKVEKTLMSTEFHNELQVSTKFKLNMATQCMFALNIINAPENKFLRDSCSEASIIQAVKDVALLGLTLNPKLAQAYLVPRKGVCCLDPSYQGMITKLNEYKAAKEVYAHVIYEGDDFEWNWIENRPEKYVPYHALKKEKGSEIGVFACALRYDDHRQFIYMPMDRITEIMENTEAYKAAKNKQNGYTIWESINRGEMIKKTAIRYLWKMMPKSEDLSEAGLIMEFHDQAHNMTDKTFTDDDKEIKPTNDTGAEKVAAAAAKAGTVKTKADKDKKIEDAILVTEIEEGSIADLKATFIEGYSLEGRSTRTLNEIKEMKQLLTERGFIEELMLKAFGNGSKDFKRFDDLLYRADVDTQIMFVVDKAYQMYLVDKKKSEENRGGGDDSQKQQ